jgi:SAM-dependent methyltransferase
MKTQLGDFLSNNPFPNGLTDGLFYREKMRAIYRIAPAILPTAGEAKARILEVGGGRSGLAALLYPEADTTTLDFEESLGWQQPRDDPFVCADACRLPFADRTFDLITMLDVIEHISDDHVAVREALRVLKPGGSILVSTPHADWRYPYYPAMQYLGPAEEVLLSEWGHVRRGYSAADLVELFGAEPLCSATFINPLTVVFHDLAFSNLSRTSRLLCYAVTSPLAVLGYLAHQPNSPGTESAFLWQY